MFRALRDRLVAENRIYIMPSGRGFVFLALIVVVVLTGATYNNNLIFLLSFLMFSGFVVSMLQTHYNLKGVRLEYVGAEDGFAGDNQNLLLRVRQKRARLKKGLEARARSRYFQTAVAPTFDVPPDEQSKSVVVEVRTNERGVFPVPELHLRTRFPLGLFLAWKIFRPKGEVVVYPRPEGGRSLATSEHDQGELDSGLRTAPGGDFGELKPYQAGESYHQIAWKQYARTGQLYTKVHWGGDRRHYEIPWLGGEGPAALEDGLKQMSRWVLQAMHEDASFEMETLDVKIEAGKGSEHARLCWRTLARASRKAG